MAEGKMTCDEAVRELLAYLDRGLQGEPLEALERHLSDCMDCCDRLAFSRALDEFVKSRLGDAPLPDGMGERIRRAIHG